MTIWSQSERLLLLTTSVTMETVSKLDGAYSQPREREQEGQMLFKCMIVLSKRKGYEGCSCTEAGWYKYRTLSPSELAICRILNRIDRYFWTSGLKWLFRNLLSDFDNWIKTQYTHHPHVPSFMQDAIKVNKVHVHCVLWRLVLKSHCVVSLPPHYHFGLWLCRGGVCVMLVLWPCLVSCHGVATCCANCSWWTNGLMSPTEKRWRGRGGPRGGPVHVED